MRKQITQLPGWVHFTSLVLLISSLAFPLSSLARKRLFPHGCRQKGFEFQDGLLLLNSEQADNTQTFFLIHNKTEYKVELKVDKSPNDKFTPSHQNTIRPYQWGAFAMSDPSVNFACYLSSSYHGHYRIDCANSVELCQYNNVKFASHNGGTFWVVSSKSLQSTIRHAIKIGIFLKW